MAVIASQTGCETREIREVWRRTAVPAGLVSEPRALPESCAWMDAAVPGPVPPAAADADPHAQDHWYRCDLPPADDDGSVARLECRGLATFAEIWLDGSLAARGANAFRPVHAPIPPGGPCRVELCFRALRPHLGGRGAGRSPRWRGRLAASEALRRIRAPLLDHMPGWAPTTPQVGPLRPVLLHREPASGLLVRHASLRATLDEDGTGHIALRLTGRDLAGHPGTLAAAGRSAPLRTEGEALVATLRLPDPPLWWPHTHGEPALVAVAAEVAGRRIGLGGVGFRRIARRPSPDGFGLVVNGVPVFCRGAIWAGPADDPLPALRRARDAGMNIVRVPGFVPYQAPAFHAACDALGLMVWQDFGFARFDYPADPDFLAEARAEARAVLDALEASPSLAVLCGGAEVAQAAAMAGRPPAEWTSPLFEEVLAAEAAAFRPDVPYVPHAPLGEEGGGLPHAASAPVAHYFGVGGYLRPPEDLRTAGVRFAAECLAFANPPDPASCRAVSAMPGADPRWRAGIPRDLGAAWDFEDVRDHYVGTLFGLSPAALRRDDPDAWLAHGRAAVALLIEDAFATWRTDGRCAGAVVLMLQDLLPGAGWGVVGHDGRPKSAWHAMRRTCRPRQVVLRDEGQNGVVLHVVNEAAAPLRARLALRGLLPDGATVEPLGEAMLDLAPRERRALPAHMLAGGRWRDLGHAWRFGPPGFVALGATLEEAESGTILSEATRFPAGPRLPATDPGLAARLDRVGEGWRLSLTAARFAQFVQVDDDGFVAEEDHFHLWPGETRGIALHPARAGTAAPAGMVSALNGARGAAAHYAAAA